MVFQKKSWENHLLSSLFFFETGLLNFWLTERTSIKFSYQIVWFFVLFFHQLAESKAVFTVVFLKPSESWVLFSVSQGFFFFHRKSPCFPEIFWEFFRPVFQNFSFGHARLTGLSKKTFFQRWAMTQCRNCVRGYSRKCSDEGNFHFGCLFE